MILVPKPNTFGGYPGRKVNNKNKMPWKLRLLDITKNLGNELILISGAYN